MTNEVKKITSDEEISLLTKNLKYRVAENHHNEQERQLREAYRQGQTLSKFSYDKGAIAMVDAITFDSIERELNDMVMREELDEEDSWCIMDDIQ